MKQDPQCREPVPPHVAQFVEKVRVDQTLDGASLARRLAELVARSETELSESDAVDLAVYARELAPTDAYITRLTDEVIRRAVPDWHWLIACDRQRNDVYDAAIRANVGPDSTVLEIGTGTGILAMMAARAGARHVYTCEIQPSVARAARRNIQENGYQDRVTVIEGDVRDLTVGGALPEVCNVLLHEVFSSDVVGEGVLELTAHARAKLLTEGAKCLPDSVWAKGQLVSDPTPVMRLRLGDHAGFNLSAMNVMGPSICARPGPVPTNDLLTDPFEITRIDLSADVQRSNGNRKANIPIKAGGRAYAVMQWIGFSFPGGAVLENTPDVYSSWPLRFHPLDPNFDVKSGDEVQLICEFHGLVMALQCSATKDL